MTTEAAFEQKDKKTPKKYNNKTKQTHQPKTTKIKPPKLTRKQTIKGHTQHSSFSSNAQSSI